MTYHKYFIANCFKHAFLCFLIGYGINSPIYSQNLVQNNGFEKHSPLNCLACPMLSPTFAAVMPPWVSLSGVAPFICDCSLKGDKAATQYQICDFNKCSPFAGCNMMEMTYSPSTLSYDRSTRGVSSYIGTTLSAPLEVGNTYEIFFWLFILPSPDSSYSRHIGFNLYPKAVRSADSKIVEGPDQFKIDTVVYGRWYKVTWLVKPSCKLQFLLLGVFKGRTSPPINQNGYHNRFYIDEVSVRKTEYKNVSTETLIPYCRYKQETTEDLVEEIAGCTLYFASGDSSLSMEAMLLLDSFAERARKSPLSAFIINGRTDSMGTDHLSLASARIDAALNYLEHKYNLPSCRFVKMPWGNSSPLASNNTEQGRRVNRRVDIQYIDAKPDAVIYRNLLLNAFASNRSEVYKLLNIWLNITNDKNKILVLFDPRVEWLRSDVRWYDNIVKKVKESYKVYKLPALAFALDSLGAEDQKCRTLKYYVQNLGFYMTQTDSSETKWDVNYPDSDTVCNRSDEQHTKILLQWIGPDNWPKATDIGARPAKNVFLLMAHTRDTAIITHYLPLLKNRCMEGEAEWLHYITLYDRLQLYRGLPQKYGTQYIPAKDESIAPILFPLENKEKVNQWRQELGIPPIKNTD